jgi:CHAT domain-containing protein/predicted negative regulator of RcsB-dependent stress response
MSVTRSNVEQKVVFKNTFLLLFTIFGHWNLCFGQEESNKPLLDSISKIEKLKLEIEKAAKANEFQIANAKAKQVFDLVTDEYGSSNYRSIDASWTVNQYEVMSGLAPNDVKRINEALEWLETEDVKYWVEEEEHALAQANKHLRELENVFGQNPLSVLAEGRIADIQFSQKKYEDSIECLSRCIKKCESVWTKHHPETIEFKSFLAKIYYQVGKSKESSNLYEQCIEDSEQFDCPSTEVVNLRMGAGMAQADLGRYSEAVKNYRSVNEILKNSGAANSFDSANCSLLLGVLHLRMSDAKKAKIELLRCVDYFDTHQPPGNPFRITSRNYLASAFYALSDLEKARNTFLQSLAECEEHLPKLHPSKATCYSGLGKIAADTGDFAKQRDYFRRDYEIKVATRGLKHPVTQSSLANVASLFQNDGEYEEAEKLYRLSLNALKESDLLPKHRMLISISLTECLMACGRIDDAKKLLAQLQKDIQNSEVDQKELWRVFVIEAELALEEKEFQKAFEACDNADEVNGAQGLDGLSLQLRLAQIRGKVALATGDYQKSEEYLDEALKLSYEYRMSLASLASYASQRNLKREQQSILDLYVCNFVEAKNESADWEINCYNHVVEFKSQVTDRQRLNRVAVRNPTFKECRERLRETNAKIGDCFDGETNPETSQKTTSLINEKNELERKLAEISGAAGTSSKKIELKEVLSCLHDNEVLLDFATFLNEDDRHLLVFVVRKNKPLKRITLGRLAPISEHIKIWTEGQGESTAAQKAGLELRRILWKPISDVIDEGNRLIVSPDASIGLVPFGALPSLNPNRFLIEDHLFTYQVSTRSFVDSRKDRHIENKANQNVLVAIGNPAFGSIKNPSTDKTYASIPATQTEIDQISTLFQQGNERAQIKQLVGDQATVQAFIENASNCTHIHLATHGFWKRGASFASDVDPEFGTYSNTIAGCLVGLVFSSSREGESNQALLNADDVANLDLANVDQTVLSGCNTGQGIWETGEGVSSLQRAFHIAGSKTVIASLWTVPDKATSKLMTRYYSNLFDKKMSKGEALRQAQIWMLRSPVAESDLASRDIVQKIRSTSQSSPYRWGGFILSGDEQ